MHVFSSFSQQSAKSQTENPNLRTTEADHLAPLVHGKGTLQVKHWLLEVHDSFMQIKFCQDVED